MDEHVLDSDFSFPEPIVLNEERDDDLPGLICELKTYEARFNSEGVRTILHVGIRDHLKPPRSRNHDSALVLTKFYDRERLLERTELEIRSPYIKKALQDVIKSYPGLNIHSKEVVITDLPKCLFHYRSELQAYRLHLDDEEACKHLDFMTQYMDQVLAEPTWRYFSAVEMALTPADTGLEFLDLWMAYRPNDFFFTQLDGEDIVMRLKSMTRCPCLYPYCPNRQWSLNFNQIVYDGSRFGYEEKWIHIPPYDGQKPFVQLKVYPLEYHERKEEVKKNLIERGKRFVGLRGAHHQEYEGIADSLSTFRLNTVYGEEDYFPLHSVMIKGRVMVDAETFGTTVPGNKVQIYSELDLDKAPKESNSEPNFFNDDYLICDNKMPGFSLSGKRWCFFKVNLLKDPIFNIEAFKSLILPEDQKKMAHSLVNIHAHEQLKFDDVIKGKGRGMIFLLHGTPGTGKTLTAESIADFTKRPLYTISSGELGTDAKSMEQNLSTALQLAETWKAIVLIDEADIFLEQRSAHDLKRNGLVSIFLRLLEYYEGILFLTTNRIRDFDTASKSRIHLAIKYSPLPAPARSQLWKLFITNTYPDTNLGWVDANCLNELGAIDLNGREIKNAFRTAHALAISSRENFSRGHIELAIRGIQRFDADLRAEVPDVSSDFELDTEREVATRPSKR